MKAKATAADRMSVEHVEFKSDTRQRSITFECVTCGDLETTIYQVPNHNQLPDVTMKIVRCADCTKRGIPLNEKVEALKL